MAEAARRPCVSAEDVRQRIRAGELKARRDNDRQVVLLEAEGLGGEADSATIVQALIAELGALPAEKGC